jgi:hypothetical protein
MTGDSDAGIDFGPSEPQTGVEPIRSEYWLPHNMVYENWAMRSILYVCAQTEGKETLCGFNIRQV